MGDNLPGVVVVSSVGWEESSVTGGGFVLPSGTVTLLLGDVEGSTRAWESDARGTEKAITALNDLVEEQVGRFDGVRPVEQGEGDSFVAAFARARDAVGCALALQRELVGGELRVRLGVHTGDVVRRGEGNYVGPAIIRTARLRNLAHGGQTVLSEATRQLVQDVMPDAATLVDLGVHRLKDLARPERVFQLCHPDLQEQFPALRSLDSHRHNLPVQRTTLIGRADEIGQVLDLLCEERLVTLTGSGGCGKTRLALHVGAECVERFADGVWFVDLATVTNAVAVSVTAMQVFGLKEGLGMTATDTVVAHLKDRHAMLIVDNCEQVLEGAASLIDALTASCPGVTVLATSRQPLGVEGEVAWRVPSLAVPPDDERRPIVGVSLSEAAQLFADRAKRARSGFSLTERNAGAVAEICRRLEGVPLAIELAAARVRVFTPAQIAEALSERFQLLTGAARTALPRQQTLEASVDWSHALLTDVEQIVFRRLAVFAGTFSFDAAREVASGAGVEAHQVLDVLSLLVDKSLVDVDDDEDDARYRLLETIRVYAQARLTEAAEERWARDRHRDHYVRLAEEAEPHFESAQQAEWVAHITGDYPNVRAALAWSHDCGAIEPLARAATALIPVWTTRGPVNDGKSWLDVAIACTALPSPLRAAVLFGRAWLAGMEWDVATLASRAEEGLAIARDIRDPRLVARCLIALGLVNSLVGGPTSSLDEGIEEARRAGDGWTLTAGLMWLGARVLFLDPPRARALYEEAVRVGRQFNPAVGNLALANLGGALNVEGDFEQAVTVLTEAGTRAKDVRDLYAAAVAQCFLAQALLELDRREEAGAAVEAIAAIARQSGIPMWDVWAIAFRGWLALSYGETPKAVEQLRQAVDASFVPIQQLTIMMMLAEAELLASPAEEALARCAQLIEAATNAGFQYLVAHAEVLAARADRRLGATASAERRAHDGLANGHRLRLAPAVHDALEVIAGLDTDRGLDDEAIRLLGAAHAHRQLTGHRRCLSERASDIATLRARNRDFDAIWEEGAALTLDEAVGYARRGRGERGRPTSGWESLTPTESRVIELVIHGCTNPEIGAELFVSARTVQSHLTRIYAKLGITGRTELAAKAALRRT